jgi:hypothetical protein
MAPTSFVIYDQTAESLIEYHAAISWNSIVTVEYVACLATTEYWKVIFPGEIWLSIKRRYVANVNLAIRSAVKENIPPPDAAICLDESKFANPAWSN